MVFGAMQEYVEGEYAKDSYSSALMSKSFSSFKKKIFFSTILQNYMDCIERKRLLFFWLAEFSKLIAKEWIFGNICSIWGHSKHLRFGKMRAEFCRSVFLLSLFGLAANNFKC